MMNGFPNPFLAPYMHMGVTPAGLMPQHAVNPNIFASQFAMRAGEHAATSSKDKAYLDHDIFNRSDNHSELNFSREIIVKAPNDLSFC
jgi:hypothetical protein